MSLSQCITLDTCIITGTLRNDSEFLWPSHSCSVASRSLVKVNQRGHRYLFSRSSYNSLRPPQSFSHHFNFWEPLAMSFFRTFLRPSSSIIPNSQPLLNLSLRQPQINAFSTTSSTLVKQKLKSHSSSKKRFFPNASGMVRILSSTSLLPNTES